MRNVTRGLAALACVAATMAPMAPMAAASAAPTQPLGFAAPVLVDLQLAGGEPFVTEAPNGNLIYSSHEGETHVYANGLLGGPAADAAWAANNRNQVNIWTSADHGSTWRRVDLAQLGFTTEKTSPLVNQGFSDPDLTTDAAGNVYNTGIDLASDAVFDTSDGGRTWPDGTAQCSEGDRPWLAGGPAGIAFVGTNLQASTGVSHTVFEYRRGTPPVAGACTTFGIPEASQDANGNAFREAGKLYVTSQDSNGDLVEPGLFQNSDGTSGVGVSVLKHAVSAFSGAMTAQPTATFTPHEAAVTTTYAHWPSIALDKAGTLYEIWDTATRDTSVTQACPAQGGTSSPLKNAIEMAYSKDEGVHWSAPVVVARPGTTVLWPWIAAGNDGSVAAAWYQYDGEVDPDCTTDAANKLSAQVATIFGADTASPTESVASLTAGDPTSYPGGVVHVGNVCQEGTTCVASASGTDRRMGDFFTNAIDRNGCVMVATGETMQLDPTVPPGSQQPVSHPIFVRQNSGMGLLGQSCGPVASVPPGLAEAPWAAGVPAAALAAGFLVWRRRQHRATR